MSNDYPIIKEEYCCISDQLQNLRKERGFYISDNKLLISKNFELNNEYNLLLSKIEKAKKILHLTENEISKKRDLLENIKNSENCVILKNKIEGQVNDFLNQKKELFKLAVMIILNTMKQDPEKDILINNILIPNENPGSVFYLISYEEKIAEIAANTLSDIALEIITNKVLN